MKIKFTRSLVLAFLLALIPTVAYAHDGSTLPFGGFLSGFIHPVLGYDHLLAMLSVGILSAQIGGRAIWTVPATFMSFMALGSALGYMDLGLETTELGIAASLLILGLIIAADRRLPILLAMAGVGFFGIFHGYAHGSEIPQTAEPVAYAFGFLAGTAIIHIIGVLIGDIAKHYKAGPIVLRVGGSFIAAAGMFFIMALI